MRLKRLEVEDFRNIPEATLEPSDGATVIIGPNGHGKTNLVEAVFTLATLRPLRAGRYAELVRFGAQGARVEGVFELPGGDRTLEVKVREGGRTAYVDGKATRALDDYFGGVTVVAFTPDDLASVKGGPEMRRKLVDRAAFNRFPAFLSESRQYQRALRSRNRLLRDGGTPSELDAFAQPLARLGARLIARRRAVVGDMAPRLASAWEAIAAGDPAATIAYAPAHLPAGIEEEKAVAEMLLGEIRRRTGHDVERGATSVGPHVDDVALAVGGRPARAYASQGQQRALVLAFKIAEIEGLRAALGRPPLLLLDDVSSELDPERNGYLMGYLAHAGLQVILTTTDGRHVAAAAGEGARYVEVRHGAFHGIERP